ncbi:hypothetical protein BGX30_002127 [Mortierella sp. GBA39]|nr:hypothetical protein BGX30_002127 [Mortierella sp. GBA39]
MKAVTYQGKKKVEVKEVGDAKLVKRDDILVRVTSTAICGSDLHIYHGLIPGMYDDYVIGHEPMGIVEETGPDVTRVKKGDRVIIPFNVACGECFFCQNQMESQCDNANDAKDTGGYFGYSETYGGYMGGQAELLRVPFGNFVPFKVPEDAEVEDEKILFLSDILPTAYWGVDNAGVKPGDTGGADVVIDCVGLDAKRTAMEKVETALMLQGGSLGAFNTAANVVRKFGTIQVIGVYGLKYNMFPFGHLFERNVQVKMGQAPVIHYMPELFRQIQTGKIDPTDIITHRLHISDAPRAYEIFDNKDESCIKVVLKP